MDIILKVIHGVIIGHKKKYLQTGRNGGNGNVALVARGGGVYSGRLLAYNNSFYGYLWSTNQSQNL